MSGPTAMAAQNRVAFATELSQLFTQNSGQKSVGLEAGSDEEFPRLVAFGKTIAEHAQL